MSSRRGLLRKQEDQAGRTPSIHKHIYRNRRHTHSINMQVTCDAKLHNTNGVEKYPGN